MSIISDLTDKIKNITSKGTPGVINKDNYMDYIVSVSDGLVNNKNVLEKITPAHRARVAKFIDSNKNMKSVKSYTGFMNSLKGTANKDANTDIFKVLETTIDGYINVMNQIETNFDSLFDGQVLTLQNTKVSQVVIFGIMRDSDILTNYVSCILNAIVTDMTNGMLSPVPKYRFAYLSKFSSDISRMVSDVYMDAPVFKKGGKGLVDIVIKDLKKNNMDINIMTSNNGNTLEMTGTDKMNGSAKQSFIGGLFGIDIFKSIGETWNAFRHKSYLKRKSEKEWMESQVALLALELEETTDEIRKAKLAKIIENYNQQLSKLDRQIQEYLGE